MYWFCTFILLISTSLFSVDFVLITQPKTATHLLKPILAELTGLEPMRSQAYIDQLDVAWEISKNEGKFIHLHAPYSKKIEDFIKKKHCVCFFINRDPRDRIVSLFNHYKNIQWIDPQINKNQSDEAILLQMIKVKLRSQALEFMGWLSSPNTCVISFEKLMGAHGGAASNAQALLELRKIANALHLNVPDLYLEMLYNKYFGTGGTFFRGKVSSWKEYFLEEHKVAAKKAIGGLLIKLGYESDYNW